MSTCSAILVPIFKPAMRLIAAITQSNPAIVTTALSIDTIAQPNVITYGTNGYVTGTIVRLDVPQACGMQEIDQKTGTITVTGANTFTIDIDTTTFSAFAIPTNPLPFVNTCAMVVPIGEDNGQLNAAVQNVLPL